MIRKGCNTNHRNLHIGENALSDNEYYCIQVYFQFSIGEKGSYITQRRMKYMFAMEIQFHHGADDNINVYPAKEG